MREGVPHPLRTAALAVLRAHELPHKPRELPGRDRGADAAREVLGVRDVVHTHEGRARRRAVAQRAVQCGAAVAAACRALARCVDRPLIFCTARGALLPGGPVRCVDGQANRCARCGRAIENMKQGSDCWHGARRAVCAEIDGAHVRDRVPAAHSGRPEADDTNQPAPLAGNSRRRACSCERRAGAERPRTFELRLLELNEAAVRVHKRDAEARGPRREHRVKHVGTERDADDDVHGVADAHDVAGLAGRQRGRALRDNAPEARLVFAAGEAADRVAWQVACCEVREALRAQRGVEAAL